MPHFFVPMIDDKIKDLSQLRDLFPGMENFTPEPEPESDDTSVDPTSQEKKQMKLYVSLDKKNRGGKKVTLLEGFTGSSEQLDALFSKLKSHCAVGGSNKNGEVILQGDHVKKVMAYLVKAGYTQTKRKGG